MLNFLTPDCKQHLLPLNERADQLAKRARSGDPSQVVSAQEG